MKKPIPPIVLAVVAVVALLVVTTWGLSVLNTGSTVVTPQDQQNIEDYRTKSSQQSLGSNSDSELSQSAVDELAARGQRR
jgi:hypothetical protein